MDRWERCIYIAQIVIVVLSIGFGLGALYFDKVFLGVTLVFLGVFTHEDSKRV